MRAYELSGQRQLALRQYTQCERILKEELGVSPQEETSRLYQDILQIKELPGGELLKTQNDLFQHRNHNLPPQSIPFIGREELMTEITRCLDDPACHLIALVGTGGCGKTRLAIEMGQRLLNQFKHGVFFVSLAPLETADAILPTVAKTLNFIFHSGSQPRQQLLSYLANKSMLLILDNFEHLLDGFDLPVDIIKAAPMIKILVTSRARLNIMDEQQIRIGGMSLPEQKVLTPSEKELEEISRNSAVRFFVQCSRKGQADFKLAPENVSQVVRTCRMVEGMPLGILLATAWMGILSPAEIADHIEHSVDFLETDLQDLPERQRSMRAVFDHTWKLLTDREQEVFRRLSVFRGGFTEHSAHEVTGCFIKELATLMKNSLLQREANGRFTIHELLRQYAAEKLELLPYEMESTRNRHCEYFFEFLQQQYNDLIGENQKKVADEITTEIDNIWAAWSWAISQGMIDKIDRSIDSLREYGELSNFTENFEDKFIQASQKLRDLLNTDKNGNEITCRRNKRVLGRIYIILMHIANILHNNMEKGAELFQISQKLLEEGESRNDLAYAMTYHGWNDFSPLNERNLYLLKALSVFKEVKDVNGAGFSLLILGKNASEKEGDFVKGRQLLEESLANFKHIGNLHRINQVRRWLANLQVLVGEYVEAKQTGLENLIYFRKIGDRYSAAQQLRILGGAALGLKNYPEAKTFFQESYNIWKDLDCHLLFTSLLSELARVALYMKNYEEAIKLIEEDLNDWVKFDPELIYSYIEYSLLGEAALGLGKLQQAKDNICLALRKNIALKRVDSHVTVLVAAFYVSTGRHETALEILGAVLQDLHFYQIDKDQAASMMAELEKKMTSEGESNKHGSSHKPRQITMEGLLIELEKIPVAE
jgi:predicted ATPase